MDDWQVGEVRFPRRFQPPPWDGRGVRFDYLKASRFDDTGSALNTATAATDQDGWSLQSLYFGNGAVLSDLTQPLTLTERAGEATDKYVYEVKFQPGYTVNIDNLHNGQGIDYRGRARYLVFLGRIVALHPDEDLKIVGRTVLKRLTKYNPHHDELGRFSTGDGEGGNTISSDIPGQVEGGGADLVAGMGGAGTGEVSKPLPEGYEVKSSGHNFFYIQGPDGVVGNTGGNTAAESVALYHQNIAGAAAHAAPAVTISEPSTAPNYPLPKGYTIEPVSDESSGVVDYAVMQEGHGVIGQFNDHDAAQQFAVEHAATQPEANDNQPPTPSTAGTGGQFKLTGEHLPAQFTVEPDKVSGGFQVLNPDGWSVTHGADAQQAVTAYFNGHPDDALPNGYTYLSGNVLDPSGNVVFSAFGSQPAAQVVEEFLNSPKVASGVFVSNSNTMITKPYDQSTAAQTLGQFHLTSYNLPAGWTVAQNATGSYTVSSPDGSTHFYGDNPTEAVNTYFDAHPQDAMPEGFTFTGNSVLDDKGNVVFAGSPNAKPSETIFNYLNSSKAPGQFQIGAGTHVQEAGKPQPTSQPFVPGAEHLPAGYSVQPGTNPGGYSWKVVNPDGAMAGGGFNQDEALHDFFNTHPEAMLPTGYKLNINHEDDTVQITDPTGKTVYDHEYNISGYEAATAFMTGNQTAGSQTTAELFSASTNAPKFVPGEEHLPAGIQVVAGNYAVPFKVVGEDGTSLATGETKEEALKDYFTYHANTLLPAGYQIGYDHIADVPIITDNNGIEVFSGDPGQGGYTAAINYLTANPALAPKAVGGDDLHDAYTLLPKGQAILSGGHGEFKIYDNDGKVVHTGVVGATATETVKEYLNVSSGVPSAAPVVHAPGPTEADLPAGVHLVNVTPGEMGGAEFKVYDQSGHSVGGQTSDQALHNYFINHADVLLPTGYKIDDSQSDGLVHITGPNGLEVHVGNANDDIVTTIQDWKAKGTETTSSLGTLPETYFGPGRPGLEPLSEAGLPPGFNVSHERGRGGDESTFVGTGEVSPPSQHQVTGDEKQTIYSYTGAGNSAINRFLREDERPDSPSDVTRRIADLDRVFADTSTAKAMTLYRGISENAQAKLDYAIAHSDGHFVDKGFLSTSSSESVAGNWKSGSYVTIEVPPGSKFLDVEHPKMLTSHPGEGEWIGARNQHFVVTKQEKSHYGYGNRTHYFIKLINAGKTQPKDTRQLDLPFVDVGPVNKQEEPYDPNEKYIWQENDIVPIHPEDIANYYRKYNDAHDALGRFAETGSTGSSSETSSGPVPKISSEHEAAIGRYTGKNSSDINQYLRFGTRRGDPAEVSGDIKALDDVLDQNRTTAPTTVWRSIDRNMVKALGKAIDKGQGVIVDKGFTSTSRKQRFASIRDVGYVSIELPTGSPAMDVKPWSRKPEEDETLIGRNQTYHASRDPSDPRHFILKLVPNVGKTGVHLYKVRVRKDDKFTWTPSDVVFLAIKYNMFHDLLGMFSSGDSGGATSEHGSTGSTAASETSINELINPSVLAAQREAVSDYTDEGYYDVNNFLRSNERPTYPTSTDSVIHHLDNLLSTASLPEETTVYRGISKSAAARMDEALANGNTTFTDKGFVSTTRDQHYATVFAASLKHNHAIVDIVLPKGSKALDIATWSSSPDEQETLVQRGSAFKLVGKTVDNDTNAPIYHVRLLSSDPQPTGRSELGKVQTHSAKYVWNGDDLDFMTEEELYTKYNHEHGEHGYFASGPGAGLSDDEKTALHDYSANSHSVNHYLRYGQTLEGDVPETVQKTVAALDSAFANTATKEPVMLYRGIGAHEAAMLDHARTGDGTYTDPAFISTTENEHLAEYFVPGGDVSGAPNSGYIEYRVPAGSAAIQLGDLARYHHEQSWLFDRDQTFKVDHIERVNSPQQPNKFKTKYVVNLVPSTKKYNEVHDPHTGEFASGSGGGGGGISLPVQGDARFRTTRSLTQPEKDAVEFYTRTTGYREINAALRRGFSMNNTPETQAHAVNLSKAVASHIVDAPLTVFRGIRNDDLINKFDQAVAAGGGEFTDKGFPSTSFSEHAAQEFTSQFQDSTHYVMRIAVPKGAHALPASIEGLGMNGEDEVILPSGSRFRVTGREQNGNQVVYDAQLVK